MSEVKNAKYWIETLELKPHPEGGFYKESYRSDGSIPKEGLPEDFSGSRSFATGIYFLLASGNVSHFHRIKSDEMWHFYAGGPLTVHVIDQMGVLFHIKLGSDIGAGEQLQGLVKAGCWFGASVDNQDDFALVGCTVSPGFDFEDFEMATRDDLLSLYPEYEDTIHLLTK